MHGTIPLLPLRLDGVVYETGGLRLIDGITAMIGAGTRTVILGPNGAGKSLLLRLCHGLLSPTGGRIEYAGAAVRGEGWARTRQAMVFQQPVLLRRSARANVTYALARRGMKRAARRDAAEAALAQVGLGALADRPARVLSGGEQQRLALARAWALTPELLYLDEPTAKLDPAATRAVEAVVEAFHRAGTKIVMTTHDLAQARRLAHDVLFLNRGRLLEHTPADEFFAEPRSADARAFLRGELVE
jgi:tungstate transport system ATP-binding protein